MKMSVHAVGRMKAGPEKELADRYFERFAKSGPAIGLEFAGIAEIAESRAQSRRRAAARRSATAAGAACRRARRSSCSTSAARTSPPTISPKRIAACATVDAQGAVIAIGGPDGHDAVAARRRPTLVLSFGALTWPHQMVRIMLGEQLYRAATILSGHPYHRA